MEFPAIINWTSGIFVFKFELNESIRRSVVSNPDLHCLPMSYKKDAKRRVNKGAAARFADWSVPCHFSHHKIGSRREKTCLSDFWTSHTQTSLLMYID